VAIASADVVSVAAPPLSVAVPNVIDPSLNATGPVGVPAPGGTAATIAVKVTGWLKADGFGEELTDVVVVAVPTPGDPTMLRAAAMLDAGPPRLGLVQRSKPVGLYAYTKLLAPLVMYRFPFDGFTAMLFGVTTVVKLPTTVRVNGSITAILEEMTLAA
jgi:hypothetical protein